MYGFFFLNFDFKVFWLWCMTPGIIKFFELRLSSYILKNTTFRKLDPFPSSGKSEGSDRKRTEREQVSETSCSVEYLKTNEVQ
jgi:hypothetical protein